MKRLNLSNLKPYLDKLHDKRRILLSLSVLVVFITTYMLILPAFTLDEDEAAKQGGIDVPETEETADAEGDNARLTGAQADTAEDDADTAEKGKASGKSSPESAPITYEGREFSVEVVDDSAVLPENTELKVKEIDEKKDSKEYKGYYEDALKAVQEEKGGDKVSGFSYAKFYDISLLDGRDEINPEEAVNVKITYDEAVPIEDQKKVKVVHFAKDPDTGKVTPEVLEKKAIDLTVENKEMTETTFEADSFSVYAVVYTVLSTNVLTADGSSYTITIKYDERAGIPDNAELTARELQPGTKVYDKYYEKTIKQVKEKSGEDVSVPFIKLFDISILADGEKIEPEAPVNVSVAYDQPIETQEGAEAEVVHFADSGVETIEANITTDKDTDDQIVSFEFEQSSFSVTATLLKYTGGGIADGKYAIVRGANNKFYALSSNGSSIEVSRNSDNVTFSNIPEDCVWDFVNQGNGNYKIENDVYNSWVTLYNGVTGTWDQVIAVEPTGTSKSTVVLRNPGTRRCLRFNGNNNSFYLGNNENGESFYLVRVNSDIPSGQGKDLKPAAETGLGDLEAWKNKLTSSKISVDKTASVYDYDNRIYKVDLKASADVHLLSNTIDLELITDTSRSMYFPATLNPVPNTLFNKVNGTDKNSLTEVVKTLDKSKIYYFIGNGEQATVYALYYAASGTNLNDKTNEEHWKYVDASYMNPPDAKTMNQADRINRLVGVNIEDFNSTINLTENGGTAARLYTSPDDITRLAYLKEAVRIASEIVYGVDRDSRIGLVTFNSEAKRPIGFTEYKNRQQLFSKIQSISLAGGTRQDLGLQEGINLLNEARPNTQKVAILITDGAPNMKDADGDTAWTMIEQKANTLKGYNSSNAKLYTLGLSMNMVGGNNAANLAGLASEEDGVTRHFSAESGSDIVTAIKSLIETLIADAKIKGQVKDAIDPAFYPVDENGNPLKEGSHTGKDGKTFTLKKETINGVEHWTVTYPDQEIGNGETDSSGNITKHNWESSFYIKAKEDFLGGNNIKTNSNVRRYDHVEATKLLYTDKITGQPVEKDAPSNLSWGQFATPYVNVDELGMTEHSNEWTVYLGTEVDPEAELNKLWNNVKIKQVVKENGTENDDSTIKSGNDKYYSKTDTADTEYPTGEPEGNYSALPITRYVSDDDWQRMLEDIKTQNTVTKTVPYSAYGHNNVGTLTVKLEKSVTGNNAEASAPEKHTTDTVGEKVEKYTLIVTYEPDKTGASETYDHTTPGGSAGIISGDSESNNEHIINVFVKGLQFTKKDENYDKSLDGAEFKLYKKVGGTETEISDVTRNGAVFTIDTIAKPEEGAQYYIKETKAPDGYNLIETPIPVALNITDTYTPKPDGTATGTKPADTVIYDWKQEATVTLGEGYTKLVDKDGKEIGHLDADSVTGMSYYFIMNNPGAVLPQTGGIGTYVIYITGLVLVLGSGAMLIRRRRPSHRG